MMIKLELTPDQCATVRTGAEAVMLTPEQARTVRGRLNASERTVHRGGVRKQHVCSGEGCKACRRTEAQRQRRAKQARGGDGAILAGSPVAGFAV
jgi:hypothetical protein